MRSESGHAVRLGLGSRNSPACEFYLPVRVCTSVRLRPAYFYFSAISWNQERVLAAKRFTAGFRSLRDGRVCDYSAPRNGTDDWQELFILQDGQS
jgi:hypothetical protein